MYLILCYDCLEGGKWVYTTTIKSRKNYLFYMDGKEKVITLFIQLNVCKKNIETFSVNVIQ